MLMLQIRKEKGLSSLFEGPAEDLAGGVLLLEAPGAPGCATGWSRWGATGTTWKSFDTRCATKRSHILLWPRSVYVTKTSVVGVDSAAIVASSFPTRRGFQHVHAVGRQDDVEGGRHARRRQLRADVLVLAPAQRHGGERGGARVVGEPLLRVLSRHAEHRVVGVSGDDTPSALERGDERRQRGDAAAELEHALIGPSPLRIRRGRAGQRRRVREEDRRGLAQEVGEHHRAIPARRRGRVAPPPAPPRRPARLRARHRCCSVAVMPTRGSSTVRVGARNRADERPHVAARRRPSGWGSRSPASRRWGPAQLS